MHTGKISINYRGFQASASTQKIVENLVNELLVEGPSFSCLKAQFTKEGEFAHVVFTAVIEIQSNAGPFFVKAEAAQMTDLAHKILKTSRRHFSKWKEKRIGDRTKIQDLFMVEEAI